MSQTVSQLRDKFVAPQEKSLEPLEKPSKAAKEKFAAERWNVQSNQTIAPVKQQATGGSRSVKTMKDEVGNSLDARWSKTVEFMNMKGQAPDEIIRVLSAIPREVSLEIAKNATNLIAEARKRVADEVGKRIAESERMAQPFSPGWGEEQAEKTPKDRSEEVESLRECIHHVAEQVMLDRATMARVEDTRFDGKFSALDKRVGELRGLYQSLLPKRQSDAEPTEVKSSGGNPKLGQLEGEKKKDFEGILTQLAVGMSKDPSTEPDLGQLNKEVETIKTSLAEAKDDEPKDCAGELKYGGFSWETVKGRFKELKSATPEKADAYMQRMWWFRRQTVDETMSVLQTKYHFDWASVGSANLESDYDISIKTHGTTDGKKEGPIKYDFEIVKEFNDEIARKLGTGSQPGTIFDTNLYASAQIKTATGETPPKPTGEMAAMTEQGQDTGALMKMRRYMNWEEYTKFMNDTLKGIDDKDQKADMKRQFEEADALYQMSIQKQLKAAYPDKAEEIFDKGQVSPGKQQEYLDLQKKLEEDSDKMMAVNNKLYVDAMKTVRDLEAELKKLDPKKEGEKAAYDELLAALKTAQADAVFFAAEAYHSEGPFKHIVEADQGAKSKVENDPKTAEALKKIAEENATKPKEEIEKLQKEKKAALIKAEQDDRLDKISPTEMLQSFNENLGDMLKDLGHYDHKSPYPGLGFYRSSKYLSRLCHSMIVLKSKIENDDAVLEERRKEVAGELDKITFDGKSVAAVKGMADALANVRGGKVEFKSVSDEAAEAEAYATDLVQKALGVGSLDQLGGVVKGVGVAVNALIRKEIAAAAMAVKDPEKAKGYFKVAPKQKE